MNNINDKNLQIADSAYKDELLTTKEWLLANKSAQQKYIDSLADNTEANAMIVFKIATENVRCFTFLLKVINDLLAGDIIATSESETKKYINGE